MVYLETVCPLKVRTGYIDILSDSYINYLWSCNWVLKMKIVLCQDIYMQDLLNLYSILFYGEIPFMEIRCMNCHIPL